MSFTLAELVGLAGFAVAVFTVGFSVALGVARIHMRLVELVGVAERALVELQDLHAAVEAELDAAVEGD